MGQRGNNNENYKNVELNIEYSIKIVEPSKNTYKEI